MPGKFLGSCSLYAGHRLGHALMTFLSTCFLFPFLFLFFPFFRVDACAEEDCVFPPLAFFLHAPSVQECYVYAFFFPFCRDNLSFAACIYPSNIRRYGSEILKHM